MPSWMYTPGGHTEEGKENIRLGLKDHIDSLTPEQRDERDHNMRIAQMIGVQQRKALGEPHGRPFPKGNDMTTPAGNALIAPGRKWSASIKRLIAEIAIEHGPELKASLLEGALAAPPKSFPYLALMLTTIDGKPGEIPVIGEQDTTWTQFITDDEMSQIRTIISNAHARMNSPTGSQVILDVVPQGTP